MNLGPVLADYRFANSIGVRELAWRIGTSSATLSRIERGKPCDGATLVKVLQWLLK